MVTEVKPLQPLKAEFPIEVTELGIVTEVKPLQPLKAELPIEVTELGMVTDVKELLLYAKYAGIVCTLSPMFIVEIGQP